MTTPSPILGNTPHRPLTVRPAPVVRRPPLFAGASALWAVPALVALAAAACSSSSGTGTGGGTSTKSTSGTGGQKTTGIATGTGAGTGSGGGMVCPPGMTYGGGEMEVTGSKSVTAVIVDETGTPVIAGQPLFICGTDLCSDPGKTTAGGDAAISTTDTEKKPAFKYGDAIAYAEFAIPITTPTMDLTMGGTGKIATAKLTGKPGATLAPGADAVSGDVTLSIPAGASIGINGLVYTTADQSMFRAVNVPLTNMGPVLAPITVGDGGPADFGLVYGLAPAETTLCPAVKVTVALSHTTMMPNDLGWAPGAAVEFWIMTIDTGQIYAPYAGWAKMSDGAVSADGMSVATADGQGFIFLENFAIRLKS